MAKGPSEAKLRQISKNLVNNARKKEEDQKKTTAPTTPIIKPSQQNKPANAYTDTGTGNKTTTPVVKPTTPVVKPTTPVVKPTTPVVKPTTPVVEPTTPIVKPSQQSKPANAYTDTGTGAGTTPVVKPSQQSEPANAYTDTGTRAATPQGLYNEDVPYSSLLSFDLVKWLSEAQPEPGTVPSEPRVRPRSFSGQSKIGGPYDPQRPNAGANYVPGQGLRPGRSRLGITPTTDTGTLGSAPHYREGKGDRDFNSGSYGGGSGAGVNTPETDTGTGAATPTTGTGTGTPTPTTGTGTGTPNVNVNTGGDLAAIVNANTDNLFPDNFNYDYNWGMDEYTNALEVAKGSLNDYTQQLLNQVSDNDSRSLFNLMKALRRNRASGLTSGASTGAQAAADVQATQGAAAEASATGFNLLSEALKYRYDLDKKQADQPANVLGMLNAYYTPRTETLANILGNYLYNGYGAQASANAQRELNAINQAYNDNYWTWVHNNTPQNKEPSEEQAQS